MSPRRSTFALCALTGTLLVTTAPHAAADNDRTNGTFDRMTVVGTPDSARLAAGSANAITPDEISEFRHTDVNRLLRQIPGIYLVEEDGLGLRPNIGIRGSGTDRNNRITVTEDGILAAPAPYAAPGAYYFPTMQRMHSVEVRKGSASVRSGPRTTGGAINLISTPIPDAPLQARATVSLGQQETLLGHAHIGGSNTNWGWLLEGVRQQSDGFKRIDGGHDAGYALDNYLGKVRYSTDPSAAWYQEIELKLGRTDQDSNETYMGLTDADFQSRPYRRYAASHRDEITTKHDLAELRHYLAVSDTVDLTSALYHNRLSRNWYKVERVNGRSLSQILRDPVTFAQEYDWMTGASSPDDTIWMRNNDRGYVSEGVQTIVGWAPVPTGDMRHSLELGVRYHRDEEDRRMDEDGYRMQDGRLLRTTADARASHTNRLHAARAWSIYVQDQIRWGSWIFTPGMRYERIDLDRTDWALTDPSRNEGRIDSHRHRVSEVIPGFGAVYLLNDRMTLLASAHKGFNPPGPGSNSESEESVNYEAGMRFGDGQLIADAIVFYNDYSNLVGTCTESTGGGCTVGDQFSGGEVRMHGVELTSGYAWRLAGLSVPVRVSYTYTSAEFRSSFTSQFNEWGTVARGDQVPYLPAHQGQLIGGLEADDWRVSLSAAYVDQMRARTGRGTAPRDERTDAYWIMDLSGEYRFGNGLALFGRVENLLDETYLAARRPAGARPGRPRTAFLGIRAEL
jgi:Fe(3+) dicitrate transport protein